LGVEALVDRVGEELLQADLLDAWNPGMRLTMLEAGRGAVEREGLDAAAVVDGELLRHVATGRVADQVRALAADDVEQPRGVADQLVKRERLPGCRLLRIAVAAQVHAHHPEAPRELRHPAEPALRAAHR